MNTIKNVINSTMDVYGVMDITTTLSKANCDAYASYYVIRTENFTMIQELKGFEINLISLKVKHPERHKCYAEFCLCEMEISPDDTSECILFTRLGYFLQAAFTVEEFSKLNVLSCETLSEACVAAEEKLIKCSNGISFAPCFTEGAKPKYYILSVTEREDQKYSECYNKTKLNYYLETYHDINLDHFNQTTLNKIGCSYSADMSDSTIRLMNTRADDDQFNVLDPIANEYFQLDFDDFEVTVINYEDSLVARADLLQSL